MNVKDVLAGAALLALSISGSSTVFGQEAQTFKVVGTWSNISAWQNYERPFWTEWLPEASGGKLKGNPISMTDAGLKGYEIVRLLKLGVFDFAHGLIGYVSEGNGLIEGGDLAGMVQTSTPCAKSSTRTRRRSTPRSVKTSAPGFSQ